MVSATQHDYERLTIRLPKAVHALLREAARANHRSLNGELIVTLEERLKTETADASAKSTPTA